MDPAFFRADQMVEDELREQRAKDEAKGKETEAERDQEVVYRYRCPGCGYSIVKKQWLSLKADLPCPRCGRYNASSFKKKGW